MVAGKVVGCFVLYTAEVMAAARVVVYDGSGAAEVVAFAHVAEVSGVAIAGVAIA